MMKMMVNRELEQKFETARNLEYVADVINGKEWRRPIRSYDILKLFGVGGKNGSGPIPPDYEWGRWVGDTWVSIQRKDAVGHPQNHIKARRRVVAQCNRCGTWVCAGHLHQHVGSATCGATRIVRGM